jgi:starvation-inducible DNA-binding protein
VNAKAVKERREAPLQTPTDLTSEATKDVSAGLNLLLADVFALYLKTKNFHWHMSGPHFRDYHLLLDEQADQLFAITDPIAERVRKIGGLTLHSIGDIKRLQRVLDNDAEYVTAQDMLAELCGDNKDLVTRMREVHDMCSEQRDVATASLLEVWIDEGERRTWFLFEATREA